MGTGVKVHVGCGSVYLSDWLNIDVPGPKTFLAADRKDLVERWKTTDDDYYARHQDKTQDALRDGPLDQEYVCDAFGNFLSLPVPAWQADEILARHSFEHLSLTEARKALSEIDSVLKEGGILRLDVPDHEATLQKFKETGDEFYIRHLLGPRRNDYGYHLMSYTRERLCTLVEEYGFVFVEEEPNIHFYPAFCLRFVKPGPRMPFEYVTLPSIPDHWNVLDVGPGSHPLPRANVYLDRNVSHLEPLQKQGKSTIIGDLSSGLPQIPDKTFDFVFCSHVLEHLPCPSTAAATLSRIGKSGVVIMPSAWKEALTNFQETEHLWSVLDNPVEGRPPIFIRATSERLSKMRNVDVMKILSRVFITGPNNRVTEESRFLRKWWYSTEPALDVVFHWKDSCDVIVLQ